MATVFERFNHLGLASSNPILMKVGVTVSNVFYNTHSNAESLIKRKYQQEHNAAFSVCDYPQEWTKDLDKIIISFLNELHNG